MLYRIIKKNQNKIFWTIGQFEFEYFGSSDVVNKLYVTFLCTENPGLNLYLLRSNLISSYWNSVLYHHAWNGSKNVRTWIDCRQQLWLKPSCSIGKLCSLYAVRGRTIGFQFELLDVVFLNRIINGSKAIMKLPWYFYLSFMTY